MVAFCYFWTVMNSCSCLINAWLEIRQHSLSGLIQASIYNQTLGWVFMSLMISHYCQLRNPQYILQLWPFNIIINFSQTCLDMRWWRPWSWHNIVTCPQPMIMKMLMFNHSQLTLSLIKIQNLLLLHYLQEAY